MSRDRSGCWGSVLRGNFGRWHETNVQAVPPEGPGAFMHKLLSVVSTPWSSQRAMHGSREASRPGTVTGAYRGTSGTHVKWTQRGDWRRALTASAVSSSLLVSAVLWLPLRQRPHPPGSGAACARLPFCSSPQEIQLKADLSKRNRNSSMRELLTRKNRGRFP